jgi:HD-like signal output (HDOD) protein
MRLKEAGGGKMLSHSQEEQYRELSAAIEDYLMEKENFGIDPRIFQILDNADSSESEIASIEKMIDVNIAVRLRSMANSVYYGMMRRGNVNNFSDVITALGMRPSKQFIIAIALFSRLGEEHKHLEIESFAISLFAKMIAEQMSLVQSAREQAEIGGLFLNIGKLVIAMYGTKHRVDIEPSFVENYHRCIAVKMIETFNLPDYLETIITEDRLVLKKNSFSIRGIVYLAQALVEKIMREHGIIEVKSPMPESKDNLEVTIGLLMADYFNLMGMGKYLKVIPY